MANLPNSESVISALGRAGYGARPEDVAEVMRHGFPAWVETPLDFPRSRLNFGAVRRVRCAHLSGLAACGRAENEWAIGKPN